MHLLAVFSIWPTSLEFETFQKLSCSYFILQSARFMYMSIELLFSSLTKWLSLDIFFAISFCEFITQIFSWKALLIEKKRKKKITFSTFWGRHNSPSATRCRWRGFFLPWTGTCRGRYHHPLIIWLFLIGCWFCVMTLYLSATYEKFRIVNFLSKHNLLKGFQANTYTNLLIFFSSF